MSDADSGVDSGNESNDPVLLAHRAIAPEVIEQMQPSQPNNNNQDIIIEIDPPETDNSSSNITAASSAAQAANSSDSNNDLVRMFDVRFFVSIILRNYLQIDDQPVMLCQDNCEWSVIAKATQNTVESGQEHEKMQYSNADSIYTPSTSNSVQVLSFKLHIDDDTMTNLNSFYQNGISQHDFCPKMTKHRKHRISHYEHLIGTFGSISFHNFIIYLISNIAEKQLRAAANANDFISVTKILENVNLNVNACDERKRTALHFAASHGNFAIGMKEFLLNK